jgi:hypothetical protein
MKIITVVLCLLAISGCASLQAKFAAMGEKSSTYVYADVNKTEASEITKDMAEFLASQLPPAKTTIQYEPAKHPFSAMLADQLKEKGFGLTSTKGDAGQAVSLHYQVTPYYQGIIVRFQYQKKEISRFYERLEDGRVGPYSSYTVREAAK